jgi:hypothetical protein
MLCHIMPLFVFQSTEVELERWVSLVLISLRVILTQSKEEAVLGRLQQLTLPISLAEIIPPCLLNDASNAQTFVAIGNSDIRASSNTEEIFARLDWLCYRHLLY